MGSAAVVCCTTPAELCVGSTVWLWVVQVPLLLGLGKEERALGAALDSGDADLVYLALFRMQRTLPLQQFLAVLAGKPQARALFSAYCAHTVRCSATDVTISFKALGVVSLKPTVVQERSTLPDTPSVPALSCLLSDVAISVEHRDDAASQYIPSLTINACLTKRCATCMTGSMIWVCLMCRSRSCSSRSIWRQGCMRRLPPCGCMRHWRQPPKQAACARLGAPAHGALSWRPLMLYGCLTRLAICTSR